MSKELEKNVQDVRIAITKLVGALVTQAVDEALLHAAAKVEGIPRTPATKPEVKTKPETKAKPQPKTEPEASPEEVGDGPDDPAEGTDGVDDFFGAEGEEPAAPGEKELSFQDVSKVFFSRFREVSVLLGVEKATDITRNLLKKYTNGKALSKATLPKEQYGEFLEKVEGIHARALEIKEQGNG